jgi:putative sporulation protein YtaF
MVLLAVSLSLDALGVGLVYGLAKINIPLRSKLIICLFSILYSGASLIFGNIIAAILSPAIAKGIGFIILVFMGTWIILQGLIKSSSEKFSVAKYSSGLPLFSIVIKSLGITIQVIKNPVEFDRDHSGSIDASESLLLGFALSVDAIGVGIGSALIGFHSLIIPLVVGVTQLLLLSLGSFLGKNFAGKLKVNERFLSVMPGILLIGLAILRIY